LGALASTGEESFVKKGKVGVWIAQSTPQLVLVLAQTVNENNWHAFKIAKLNASEKVPFSFTRYCKMSTVHAVRTAHALAHCTALPGGVITGL
jgi:hypothetical protein